MQILYLIGNGFDINLNMKTRYTDFYKYYKRKISKNEVIIKLKSKIEEEKEKVSNWSDLEFSLGEYTSKLKSYEEFEIIYDDLLEKFGDYLQKIEDKTDWKLSNINLLKEYLCYPERSLMQREINDLNKFKNLFKINQWEIDIVTFNYTRSIERLLDENFKNINIGKHHNGTDIRLKNVLHIHGDLKNMVLGVNDISQLENKDFHSNNKILKAFIKPFNNRRQGHTIDDFLERKISQSNLICIFGSSLGETDKIWWEKIGKHLLTNDLSRLIIFTTTNISPKRAIHKIGDYEDEFKDLFLKRSGLNDDEREIVNDKIYVRANTNMFSSLLAKPDSADL